MERIVLEVNDQTAKALRNTSAKLRAQIGKNLEQILADSLNKTTEANFELLLQEPGKKRLKTGLPKKYLLLC